MSRSIIKGNIEEGTGEDGAGGDNQLKFYGVGFTLRNFRIALDDKNSLLNVNP